VNNFENNHNLSTISAGVTRFDVAASIHKTLRFKCGEPQAGMARFQLLMTDYTGVSQPDASAEASRDGA